MLLPEAEVQRSRTRVAAAFPRFTDWEHANAADEDYEAFAVWGRYTPPVGVSSPTSYFVTFDSYKEAWRGHLTVGKHCYYWSSADVGDAYLLETEACATLDEAIASLIGQIGSLCAALSGSKA
jgi:hypothetical protein